MELTQENFDTLMNKSQWLEKALQEARSEKKQVTEKFTNQINEFQSKFDEIEKGKSSAKEQDLIKKGKYEAVLEQKNSILQDLEARLAEKEKKMEEMNWIVTQFNEYKAGQEAKMLEQVASKLEWLDEAKRWVVLDLIKDKPIDKQLEYADQLLWLQVTPDYKATPAGGDKPAIDPTGESYNKAKQSGDLLWMIVNAKTID